MKNIGFIGLGNMGYFMSKNLSLKDYIIDKFSIWLISAQPSRAVSLLEEHECISKFIPNNNDLNGIKSIIDDNIPVAIKNNNEGFTLLEIILMAMVFGTISSIAVPQFEPIVNKFRQKEATGIVNSMIKSAQSNYALFARIPEDMGEISKFSTISGI